MPRHYTDFNDPSIAWEGRGALLLPGPPAGGARPGALRTTQNDYARVGWVGSSTGGGKGGGAASWQPQWIEPKDKKKKSGR